MRKIMKVGGSYLWFHSPGESWHFSSMSSEPFMSSHNVRYLRGGRNYWSQIFTSPRFTPFPWMPWAECISLPFDFRLGHVTYLWLMKRGQKWQCIGSEPRPEMALHILISLVHLSHHHKNMTWISPSLVQGERKTQSRAGLLRWSFWSLLRMWQESRNVKQILFGDLILILNLNHNRGFLTCAKISVGWASLLGGSVPCSDPRIPSWGSTMLLHNFHRLCERGGEKWMRHTSF